MVGEKVGEGMAQERTVIGETPNLAARLQSLGRPQRHRRRRADQGDAGDAFDYEDLGAHELKGIAGLVQAWARDRAARRWPRRRRDRQRTAASPPLVGRDEEIGLLRRAWESTKDEGRGQVVLISGEAGIGKTALVEGAAGRGARRGTAADRLPLLALPHEQRALSGDRAFQAAAAAGSRRRSASASLAKLEAGARRPTGLPLAEAVPLFAVAAVRAAARGPLSAARR